MEAINIRKQLHEFIDTIEDKKAEAIYTLLADELDTDMKRRKLIKEEREKFLRAEGKSFSWEEVKQMAMSKETRTFELHHIEPKHTYATLRS